MIFDVAIVGAGPGGSTCATICAEAGCSTLLLERARFPREKVCGDCVNPGCWPILDRLGVSRDLVDEPHAVLRGVRFIGIGDEEFQLGFPRRERGMIGIKRSVLDNHLLRAAVRAGAQVLENAAVHEVEAESAPEGRADDTDRARLAEDDDAQRGRAQHWIIRTADRLFRARVLVAADGRNSTIGRLLQLLPSARKERVGLQMHLQRPAEFSDCIGLQFFPGGYCGMAMVSADELNICLVSQAAQVDAARSWAAQRFGIDEELAWRTITPLSRAPVTHAYEELLFVGDAARVVEPFTGEGIYYALASGELAARCIIENDLAAYRARHAALYRGRLWINRIARMASLHPRMGTQLVRLGRSAPHLFATLVDRVIGRENGKDFTSAEAVSDQRPAGR